MINRCSMGAREAVVVRAKVGGYLLLGLVIMLLFAPATNLPAAGGLSKKFLGLQVIKSNTGG